MLKGLSFLRAWQWPCAAFFFLCPCGLLAEEDTEGEVLWARAEEMKLWESPEWWTLGHYHRTLWRQVVSRIDDPRFFLHPKGKTNRRLELKATLEAMRTGEAPGAVDDGRTIACRFPARRAWLLDVLELSEEAFQVPQCQEFLEVLETLQIHSASVIYPAAYVNSPASMFGHLLLVLDREGKDRLLSRAVNYAAAVDDSFGPLFALKGIFGLYNGVYTVLPYYDKVEEYAAVNRRDIWEYTVTLEEAELQRMLEHVWELQELYSRYYFFKENCAFNLLYPLEAGRPSLHLTRPFRTHAIPVSMLRDLSKTGILGEATYRPSNSTRMAALAEALTSEQRKRALEISRGSELQQAEDPLVLTLAVDLVQLAYTEQEITPEVYRQRIFPLLRARSKMGKVERPEPEPPLPPHQGHGPQRVDLYVASVSSQGESVGFRWRAAYHDELDDPRAYPVGSSIRFFDLDLRSRPDEWERWGVHRFSLVEIRSLTPPSLWAHPLSWNASLRVEEDPFDLDHHGFFATFAAGKSWSLGASSPVYLMWSNDLRRDTRLDDNWAWEPGGQWGIRGGGPALRAGLEGRHHVGVWGSEGDRHEVTAEVRHSFSLDLSISLEGRWRKQSGTEQESVRFSVMRTF